MFGKSSNDNSLKPNLGVEPLKNLVVELDVQTEELLLGGNASMGNGGNITIPATPISLGIIRGTLILTIS